MKSLRDEICLTAGNKAEFISSEAVGGRFRPSFVRISSERNVHSLPLSLRLFVLHWKI